MDTYSLILSILALLTAAVSATFTRQQVHVAQATSRVESILTLVNYLQRPDIRDGRRVVITDLENRPVSDWTVDQRAVASGVAASYDLVGTLVRTGVVDGALILQSYGASIIRCHGVCSPMVSQFRNEMPAALARSYWNDFDWLADEARMVIGYDGPVWPPDLDKAKRA